MSQLQDKVIVITGASSGIGEATARMVASQGAKVVLAARRVERLVDTVKGIDQTGGTAAYLQTDVTSKEDMQELANFTVGQYGKIDVWINNAGIMPRSFLNKLKVDEWDRMVDVNIKGVLYGIAAALPIMEKQNHGHIVNVSSIAGHRVALGGAVYSATKFAVNAITEGLRLELSSSSKIRATIVSPGAVYTELRNTITDKDALNLLETTRNFKYLNAEDVATAIVYALQQPEHVSINEVLIRPTEQGA